MSGCDHVASVVCGNCAPFRMVATDSHGYVPSQPKRSEYERGYGAGYGDGYAAGLKAAQALTPVVEVGSLPPAEAKRFWKSLFGSRKDQAPVDNG